MPSTGSRDKLARSFPLLLPLLALLLYALTSPGLTRGAAAGVYATAAALVDRGHPALDGAVGALAPAPQGADAIPAAFGPVAYAAGHYYHAAPPGPALLATPAYALGLLLAPLLGPTTPTILVVLLGPLLGALAVSGFLRLFQQLGLATRERFVLAVAAALFLWPLAGTLDAPLVAATLVAWLLPTILRLVGAWGPYPDTEQPARFAPLLAAGLGLGALVLIDYGVGILGLLTTLALAARWRRVPRAALALLVAAAAPGLLLAAYQTVAFGRPWGLAFRLAVDPAARSFVHLFRPTALLGALLPLAFLALGWLAATRRRGGAVVPVVLLAGGALVALATRLAWRRETVLPLDWRVPAVPLLTLLVVGTLALASWLAGRRPARVRPGLALPLALLVSIASIAGPIARGATAASPNAAPENDLAPFAIVTRGETRTLWTLTMETQAGTDGTLRLAPHGNAVSPWVDVTPGTAYQLSATSSGAVSAIFSWEDAERRPLAQQAAQWTAGDARTTSFAAPVGAAGLRIAFAAGPRAVTLHDARLVVAAGARVEPFPDYAHAALAFSFDWESAMGGLIHTRSGPSEGEGAGGALNADGSPSVADAEARGRQMREGARFLAANFARDDIHATFYATGYDLLDGNPTCQKFLGDPIYKNVDRAHGWGSDFWQTHPWYLFDPCTTEQQAPAWYFGSLTRELAAAGHEIASHTFGHLYVRGVTPEQLAADLELWQRTAARLGITPAPSFAFPWTSSNSLDGRFYAVFQRLGLTVLTRLYQPLRHPFELDRVPENPALSIFPDQYLPSTPAAEAKALGGIDEVLARRGYFSLWAHPEEVMQQDGPVIWPRVIDYAAAQRARGLWVAPVTKIARYSLATRDARVTALPVAGGWRLTVENGSAQALDGLTLSLPASLTRVTIDGRASSDVRGGQLRLPSLAPGASVVVLATR